MICFTVLSLFAPASQPTVIPKKKANAIPVTKNLPLHLNTPHPPEILLIPSFDIDFTEKKQKVAKNGGSICEGDGFRQGMVDQ
jgi:hypothetical protein